MLTLSGWLNAALLVLVLAKFASKRLRLKRANAFLMKHHRSLTFALIALTLVHGVLSLLTLGSWSPAVLLSGVAGFLCILAAARSAKRRNTTHWLKQHRRIAASALLFVIIHIILHTHH